MNNHSLRLSSIPEKLECQIQIFKGDKVVFEHKFGALANQYRLSSSGKYFAISLNSSEHEDSRKVFIFDVEENQLLFSGDLGIGHIYEFFFFNEAEDLYAKTYFGTYEIDKNGEVVDLEKVHSDAVFAANVYSIDYMERYLTDNQYSESAIRQVVHSLDRIIDSQFNQFHGIYWAALALRRRGEYLEMLNENEEALLNYIDAIYLDGKIGVKRKLTKLSKELSLNWQDFTASERALRIEESCKLNREMSIAESEKNWQAIYDKNSKIVEDREVELLINLDSEPKDIELVEENKIVKDKINHTGAFIKWILIAFLNLISFVILKPIKYFCKILRFATVKILTFSWRLIYWGVIFVLGIAIFLGMAKFFFA